MFSLPLKDRPGVALILAVLVTVILSASVLAFIKMSHLEARMADNTYVLAQAEILAQAGLKGAMALLASDNNDFDAKVETELWNNFDTFAAMSGMLFEEGTFTGKIEDLSGRFNLNFLIDKNGLVDDKKEAVARRLLSILELDPELIVPILDWIDPDDDYQHGPGGAEAADYGDYPCGNGPMDTIGQLALVKGFTAEMLYGSDDFEALIEFFTVHSDGKVNVNTASSEVLLALDEEMTEAMAAEIIAYRESAPFDKLDTLKDVSGITPEIFNRIVAFVSVKTTHFLVTIEGRFQQSVVRLTAVLKRDNNGVELIYYKSG